MFDVGGIQNGNGVRRFRKKHETSRVIETVDGCRRRHRSRTKGRMNTTGHETILGILERRARRFRPDMRLVQEHEQMNGRIDETGTLRAEKEVVDDERALAARVVEA